MRSIHQRYWDDFYDTPEPSFGYRPTRYLARNELWIPRASRVLVLGDGDGRHGSWLAYRGHEVTTVDFSEVAVRKAHLLAEQRGVSITAHHAELGEWVHTEAAEGPWDAIVSLRCTLRPDILQEVGQTLGPRVAPGGRLLLEDLAATPGQLCYNLPFPASWLPTENSLREAWQALHLDVRQSNRRVYEGSEHRVQRALLQVLGVANSLPQHGEVRMFA